MNESFKLPVYRTNWPVGACCNKTVLYEVGMWFKIEHAEKAPKMSNNKRITGSKWA